MIDTSAILAWLKEEPERARIVAALEAHSARRLSAVSLLEAQIVVRGREHPALLEKLERFLDEIEVLVTPFDETRRAWPPMHSSAMAKVRGIRRSSIWATVRSTPSPNR